MRTAVIREKGRTRQKYKEGPERKIHFKLKTSRGLAETLKKFALGTGGIR